MFNDENNRSDALGQRLQKIGGQMNPSPALKKAAKTGVPLRSVGIRYTAGTHVRKFTKAVLLYAACIALFLGAILLIPKWFGGNGPVADSGSSDRCNHKYVALTMGLAPSCTEGTIRTYRCQYCGHSYSEQDPAPGHNIVDGVCTRCGEKEAETPSLSLDQFGDPAVINSVLNRMGLQFDKFANETPGEVKDFLGRGEVDGFLVTYYYTCEKLSPMELYYSFGEKRRMTNDDIASLKPGQPTQAELAADWYCFTGKDALALLTQYAAVEPTWSDQLRAMLLAYGYYYDADTDTFYNCAIDPSCMLAYGIHVTGCAQMKSGELVVFYATFEGEKRMVILKSDGDNYRFAGNCPTDYLYRDGTEPMCEHGQDPTACPYCNCDEHVWTPNETPVTCTQGAYVVNTCIKCGYSFTEWMDALGHDYKDGTCTRCGEKQPDCLAIFLSGLSEAGKPITIARKLTAEELKAVKAFSDIPDVRMLYGAGYQAFYRPEDISLYELLYASNIQKEFPDNPFGNDGSMMTVTRIREVVRTYTGIEVTQEMLDQLVADGAEYYPDSDAYGFVHTDAGGLYPEEEMHGYLTEDGKIIVHVIAMGDNDHVLVLLVPTDDGYLIESAQWVDERIISGCHFSSN